MKLLRTLTLLALSLGFVATAGADTLKMDGMASADMERPTRGMTKGRVESKFGAPESRQAPVGDPPITRWEYEGFIVYFEYQYVLHTVVRRDRR